MKYIIVCNNCDNQLLLQKVYGESLVERTIRILLEYGVSNRDIYVTSNNSRFSKLGVFFIECNYTAEWIYSIFDIQQPACYLFGNIYYYNSFIADLVKCNTNNINIFGIKNKKTTDYIAYKIANNKNFTAAINQVKKDYKDNKLKKCTISELSDALKKDYNSTYTEVDDGTTVIKSKKTIETLEKKLLTNPHIMIHAVGDREWYVKEYLIPSLEKQGLTNISLFSDRDNLGNLAAYIESCKQLPNDGYTWHLQDDVIISKNFANVLKDPEYLKYEVVCGFASKFDNLCDGPTIPDAMWYSFPCIKLPNRILKGFIDWCKEDIVETKQFKKFVSENKYDDALVKGYLRIHHPKMPVMNLNPNIVNHIDYLLGGSIANPKRYKQIRKIHSRLWEEPELIEWIEKELDGRVEDYYVPYFQQPNSK